jgi:hypothetical protein
MQRRRGAKCREMKIVALGCQKRVVLVVVVVVVSGMGGDKRSCD